MIFYSKNELSQKQAARLKLLKNKLDAYNNDTLKYYARMTPKQKLHCQRNSDRFAEKYDKENMGKIIHDNDYAEYKGEIRDAQDPKYKH